MGKGLCLSGYCLTLVLAAGLVFPVQAAVMPVEKQAALSQPADHAAKASVVAIVDVQRILQSSNAAKSVQQQLDAQRSKFQSEIAAEESDLRDAEQKLSKLRESAKANDYVEQEQKLQQRFLTVERHVQARRKALDQAFTDSMNVVRKALVDIVSQIAKKRGVNLVIVKQQVIWNDDVIDITDEVLGNLDKDLPNVQVKVVADDEVTEKDYLVKSKKLADPVPKGK